MSWTSNLKFQGSRNIPSCSVIQKPGLAHWHSVTHWPNAKLALLRIVSFSKMCVKFQIPMLRCRSFVSLSSSTLRSIIKNLTNGVSL